MELASRHGRSDLLPALWAAAGKVPVAGDNEAQGRADRASMGAAPSGKGESMLKIENDVTGYMVRCSEPGMGRSRSWRQKCRDLAEVHHCIDHYFRGRDDAKRHGNEPVEGCPLCKGR